MSFAAILTTSLPQLHLAPSSFIVHLHLALQEHRFTVPSAQDRTCILTRSMPHLVHLPASLAPILHIVQTYTPVALQHILFVLTATGLSPTPLPDSANVATAETSTSPTTIVMTFRIS